MFVRFAVEHEPHDFGFARLNIVFCNEGIQLVCVLNLGEFNALGIEVAECDARVPGDFEQDCELGVGEVSGLAFAKQGDASQRVDVVRERCRTAKVDALRFHHGQGTVVATEMCLLNEDRNPQHTEEQIEEKLSEYFGIEKVIWIKGGIDPYETNGHVDDVACFSALGEVCCMWADDPNHKFYKECQEAYRTLSEVTDARGRKLKVHKVIMPATSVYMTEDEASTIDPVEGVLPRTPEDAFEPSYLNFLPINGAVLVPQFGDPSDA